MPKIENMKKVAGRDKKGNFIAELVTVRGAKYGHIVVYREDGGETNMVTKTYIVLLLFYVTRIFAYIWRYKEE